MILLHKELIEKYKSDYEIKKLIQEGKIFKIEKGIYSDKKDVNYLEIISKKYPNAIFTMDSAFYYHNLTDVIPEKEHLALKRDSTKISDSRIKVVYYQDKFFDIGKCWIPTYVYNACVPWSCDSNVSVCHIFVNCLRAYI